jgi:hypothetical protein
MGILIFFSSGILMLLCLYYGTKRVSAETKGKSWNHPAQMKDVWFIYYVRSALNTTVNM